MLNHQHRLAKQELAACRAAFGRGDQAACDLHGSRVLSLAGDDPLLVAEVCLLKGKAERCRGLDGLALRNWAIGLEQLQEAGLADEPLDLLLRQSIESLRRDCRVMLSYSPADLPLALWLTQELSRHGFDVFRGDPPAEAVVCDCVMAALDRSAWVLVLWSHGYRSRPHCVTELAAVRARLIGWHQLAAAPQLVMLRCSDEPVPGAIADLDWVDFRRGVDPRALGELRAAIGLPAAAESEAVTEVTATAGYLVPPARPGLSRSAVPAAAHRWPGAQHRPRA